MRIRIRRMGTWDWTLAGSAYILILLGVFSLIGLIAEGINGQTVLQTEIASASVPATPASLQVPQIVAGSLSQQAPLTAVPLRSTYAGRWSVVRLGTLSDNARLFLAGDWKPMEVSQNERAYCAVKYTVRRQVLKPGEVDSIFVVDSLARATMWGETPVGLNYSCPRGQPDLHVHTPTTCHSGRSGKYDCALGGVDAWQCQPSRVDLERYAKLRWRPLFRMIQCDGFAVRFYYPTDIP